jgi:hypothetical protein
VIAAILTDGKENPSRRFSYPQVVERIEHQQDVYKWQFLFLGANQDAIADAGKLAIGANAALTFGLMPIFWTHGRGSDVMQPMAIPSVGGLAVSLCVTIFIAPCLFCAVEEWKWKRAQRLAASGATV